MNSNKNLPLNSATASTPLSATSAAKKFAAAKDSTSAAEVVRSYMADSRAALRRSEERRIRENQSK